MPNDGHVNPWMDRVKEYKRRRAEAEEKARDLDLLLASMPPGVAGALEDVAGCAEILHKYGVMKDAAD